MSHNWPVHWEHKDLKADSFAEDDDSENDGWSTTILISSCHHIAHFHVMIVVLSIMLTYFIVSPFAAIFCIYIINLPCVDITVYFTYSVFKPAIIPFYL